MSSGSLPGYDAWKTRGPDEGPVCEKCGGWLSQTMPFSDWFCADCEDEEQYLRAAIDEQEEMAEGEALP